MTGWFRRSAIFYPTFKRFFVGKWILRFLDSKVPAFLFGTVVAVFLKKWIDSNPLEALEWIVTAVLILFCYQGWRLHKENRSASRAREASRHIMRPDPEAELLARSSNQSRVVVGNTIELFVNPNLTSLKPLDRIGWSPSDVSLTIPRSESRTFDHVLREIGGVNGGLRPPNGAKFGLARTSLVTNDSDERPNFDFYRTDYFTQQSVYYALKNASLRNRFASLDPVANQIPNATGLQSLVLFRNDDVLCMLRDERVDGEGGPVEYQL